MTLKAGTTYRLRLINILTAPIAEVELSADSVRQTWHPTSKDGADVPESLRRAEPALKRIGVGETYDFEWTPTRVVDAVLEFRIERTMLRQHVRVR